MMGDEDQLLTFKIDFERKAGDYYRVAIKFKEDDPVHSGGHDTHKILNYNANDDFLNYSIIHLRIAFSITNYSDDQNLAKIPPTANGSSITFRVGYQFGRPEYTPGEPDIDDPYYFALKRVIAHKVLDRKSKFTFRLGNDSSTLDPQSFHLLAVERF
jgi:hypothetical protein